MKGILALGLLLGSIGCAAATPSTEFAGDRYTAGAPASTAAYRSVRKAPRQRSHSAKPLIYLHPPQANYRHIQEGSRHQRRTRKTGTPSAQRSSGGARSFIADAAGALITPTLRIGQTILGGRPSGCPSRFCGCALSIRVFGHSVRNLWLAANWLRFPRAAARPGMVAARRGHVFQLLAHLGGSVWRVYDPNSGHGRIREHARSIAGYAIVNPGAGSASRLAAL